MGTHIGLFKFESAFCGGTNQELFIGSTVSSFYHLSKTTSAWSNDGLAFITMDVTGATFDLTTGVTIDSFTQNGDGVHLKNFPDSPGSGFFLQCTIYSKLANFNISYLYIFDTASSNRSLASWGFKTGSTDHDGCVDHT